MATALGFCCALAQALNINVAEIQSARLAYRVVTWFFIGYVSVGLGE
ncbi:MAG: hypothetical protein JSR65_07930 [Proteobacteria bacterium]|nr:hypothetical protein [Pseudomonadota bacterium]